MGRFLHPLQGILVGAVCALAGCSGGGGGAVDVGPGEDPILAEASIGPAGGVLRGATSTGVTDVSVELEIAAGAVAVPTLFRVRLDVDGEQLPSLFPVYRIEPAAQSFAPGAVTVRVQAGDVLFGTGVPPLTMFRRDGPGSPWLPVLDASFDGTGRVATAVVDRLGEFVVLDGNLHRLFTQPFEIPDPSDPLAIVNVNGATVIVDPPTSGGSPTALFEIGSGSLASFWNSSAKDNVLILPGVLGSPADFLGGEDLVANLSLIADNVVLLSYPSARGVRDIANRLYDTIQANRRAGFGCSIVGHSMGGLVGRYLLEQSPTDPDRAGFAPGDPALTDIVDHLVMIGTPNAGAPTITQAFSPFVTALPLEERRFLQTAHDLDGQPGSLPLEMNSTFVDNATVYHVVYGDVGGGSDGVVSTSSALAVPLSGPETVMMFPGSHDDLHRRATSLGVAVWVGGLLQGP